jgi:hypothetical protein
MTNWIEWNGGECPIKSDKTRVEYRCANGFMNNGANCQKWNWGNDIRSASIIAYRIIEDHEPMAYPRDPKTREHITAQIEALQKQLDAMPVVLRKYWGQGHTFTHVSGAATHYFDIETINGVPHIHGIAMKEVGE